MTIEQTVERKRFDAELAASGCVTVSNATLRSQDLLPKFLDALRVVAPEAHQQMMMPGCGFPAVPSHALEDEDDEWWDSEDCAYLLNEVLFDALNEHAPEGYYFGSHEGDGACFGFWQHEDDDV
jgi:hypothetical protein